MKTFESFQSFEAFLKKQNTVTEDVNDTQNYMFFGNLQTIKRHAEMLLALDEKQVDDILKNGHDWAEDHIATCKDDIEEVCNFFQNEVKKPGTGIVPESEEVNEAYKKIPSDMKISGEYEVTVGSTKKTIKIAGFERENDDSDSLYLMDDEPLKATVGSFIVKNSEMPKVSKGQEIKCITSKGEEAKIKRIGNL